MTVREILRELVLRPSTEADDPGPVLAFAGEIGESLGARATRIENGARPALLLAWGTPRLLFSGHLDYPRKHGRPPQVPPGGIPPRAMVCPFPS